MGKLFGLALLAMILFSGWLAWDDWERFNRTPLKVAPEGEIYLFESGASVARLAQDLEQKGWIANGDYLRLLARLEGQGGRLRAGEYRIEPGTTPRGLLELLASGKVVVHKLTIVEGWSFRQMREAVAAHPVLRQTLAGLPDDEWMRRLGHPDEHPEGRFLADTYHLTRGATDLELFQRSYDALRELLAKEWVQRSADLPLADPYQGLILASIVEKETAQAAERPQIAGVFVRRLKRGMLLQTDPTVIYGMGDAYDGNIRRRDLEQDTPYNTYTRPGLPPTPICLPGRDAIRAALRPAAGDTLYFVAKGDGGRHHFSATLNEHNRAVREYQLKGRGAEAVSEAKESGKGDGGKER